MNFTWAAMKMNDYCSYKLTNNISTFTPSTIIITSSGFFALATHRLAIICHRHRQTHKKNRGDYGSSVTFLTFSQPLCHLAFR